MKQQIKTLVLLIVVFISLNSNLKSQNFEISQFPNFDTISIPQKPLGPEWMHKAAFYQIYPQTFYDTDGDGIGDLKGVIAKLDYVKGLGVDAIWLNPFYVSPFRDAGYDVSDYYNVAPRYGKNQDAKDLFRIAKEKGIRVIIDFVPGHTSVDHPWFIASSSPQPNKYSNWYIWTNSTWLNGNLNGNFIQGYSDRDGNYMTNFFWHQPALNYGYGMPDPQKPWQLPVDHPDVVALKNEMKNIMKYWLQMGCSGFRVDMAGSLVKNDPEGSIKFFWLEVRKMLETEFPDAFMISEWSNPKAAINAGFHSDFMHWFEGYNDLFTSENSFFRASGKGDISHFLYNFFSQYASTKGKGYISLPVGNHDVIRINNKGRDQRDLEIIQVFNFTMPNVPFVYYGDEIGMRQLDVKVAHEGSYGLRGGARTPMQWNGDNNFGFSTASPDKLYLPVDTAVSAPNVMLQETDDASMLHLVRKLTKLHKTEPALHNYATFIPVYAQKDKYPFIYLRVLGKEKVLVVLNPSASKSTAILSGKLVGKQKLLIGELPKITIKMGTTEIAVLPKTYSVIKLID